MTVSIKAQNARQIVVPVRFARAVTGPAQFDAPDIDNRGFIMNRPPGLDDSDARGPMFAIALGQTVRIKVVREEIDQNVSLFATVEQTDEPQIEIPEEHLGVEIPADGIIHVHAVADTKECQKLQIRIGSTTGPIIAEAEPHTFSFLTVPITPHLVPISFSAGAGGGGVAGTMPALDTDAVLARVRKIWRACGIDFTIQPVVREAPVILPSNTVDTAVFGLTPDVFQILGLQRKRLGLPAGTADRTINWYVIQQFDNTSFDGIGISKRDAAGNDPGIISTIQSNQADGTLGNNDVASIGLTVAHEIGHFFLLNHPQLHNGDNPVRDSFGRGALMFPTNPLPAVASPPSLTAMPRLADVGYGNLAQGERLGIKKHFNTDSELHIARNAIRSNAWF